MKPALLLLFLVACTLVWFWAGARPQHWDSAIHLGESLNANRIGEETGSSAVRQALFVSWYYPPFVSYTAIPVYKLFGESEFSGLLVMTLFLGLLVASTYALGAQLFGGEAGFLAAALVAACPVAVEFSHTFMLDLPMAAMATVTTLFIVRSENFSRLPCSLFAGLAFGCGLLTKWTFPAVVLGPALLSLAGALKADAKRRRRLWTIAAAIAIALLVALPWYLVHAVQIITSRGGELRQEEFAGFSTFLTYLTFIPLQASWPLALLMAAGAVLFFARVRAHGLLLAGWFITSELLLSLIGFKLPRFSISLLVPLALLAAGGLATVLSVRWARASLFALCGAVYIAASFVPAGSAAGRLLGTSCFGEPLVKTDGPIGDRWHQREIAERIARDARARGVERVNVRVVPDLVYFNNATLAYQTQLLRLPLNVTGISGYPLFTDYAVVTTGRVADAGSGEERGELTRRIRDAAIFTEVARWPLPDSAEAIVLRLDPKPSGGASPGAVVAALRSSADQFVRRYLRASGTAAIEIGEYSGAETQRGHIREIRIRAESAELGDFMFNPVGLRVKNVDCALRDVQCDVGALMRGNLELYAIGGADVRRLRLSAGDLADYAQRTAELKVDDLTIDRGMLALKATPAGFGKTIDVRIALETLGGRDVGFTVDKLSVAGIPVPAALVNAMASPFTPLLSGLRQVPDVRLGTLVLENNLLELR